MNEASYTMLWWVLLIGVIAGSVYVLTTGSLLARVVAFAVIVAALAIGYNGVKWLMS